MIVLVPRGCTKAVQDVSLMWLASLFAICFHIYISPSRKIAALASAARVASALSLSYVA